MSVGDHLTLEKLNEALEYHFPSDSVEFHTSIEHSLMTNKRIIKATLVTTERLNMKTTSLFGEKLQKLGLLATDIKDLGSPKTTIHCVYEGGGSLCL